MHPSLSSGFPSRACLAALLAIAVASPATAQAPKPTKQAVGGLEITGLFSSGKHCVSGSSANVHALGWIERGSAITIRFRSGFDPVAGVVTLGIDTPAGRSTYIIDDDSGGNLDPEIRYTASISGNAALYVSGFRSTSGCYWYNFEMTPPAASVTRAAAPAPAKSTAVRPAAITGAPSIAYHCIAGDNVTNIHSLGRVGRGARITVTFDTDYDAVAGLVNMDLFAADPQPRYVMDDDSGGALAPELRLTTTQEGTVTLFVGGYSSIAGCYRFRVEIQ